jgi:hypothetical protein
LGALSFRRTQGTRIGVDFSRAAPDFVARDLPLAIEATIASHALHANGLTSNSQILAELQYLSEIHKNHVARYPPFWT